MASPRGGFADKIGNRFEANYLVMAALGLLDGELRSLRWEGVGNEFEGIEYRSRLADGTTEAVQCKSNRDKAWTLAALASAGLLAAMRVQLTNGVDRFALILASKATDLHSLCQRARASASIGAFRQSLSGPLALQFERLLSFWNLSCTAEDQESARHWLSRIRVDEHCTPEYVDRAAERRCADLFEGPPGTTRAAIRDILEEHLGQEITADLLVSLLRSDRFKINPRDWGRLPDHVAGVQRLCDRFRSQLGRLLIRGQLIPRTESEAALKAIVDPAGPRTVLLHGGAGTGKSGVLYELAVRLAESGTCVIPLRLDNALPSGNLLRYSREMLGLPDTPGRCASRMSPGRRSVVMVDQLDAVRWAGVHSNSAWDVTLELLDEAMHTPDVSVVVACRTFDMKDDPNLRHWRSEQAIAGRIQEIEVKPLDDAIVSKALGHDGGVPPNKKQAGILRNPLMLSMWCELSDRGVDVRGISASSQLMSEHWKSVKRRLSDRHGMSDGTCEQAVDAIRAYLESQGRLDFPAQIVANQRALDALASESFLDRLDQSRFRVSHQRYLDHQVALAVFRDVIRVGSSVCKWLLGSEQTLARREQVRHVLALLRDGQPDRYLAALTELLASSGTREHIRDLALRLLAEVDAPLDGEVSLVLGLAKDREWIRRVRHRILVNPTWWRLLLERGVLRQWVISQNRDDWSWAAWVCGRFAEHDPESISEFLIAVSREAGFDPDRRLHCLPFDPQHDTATMAVWRFRAQRRGEIPCEPHDCEHVAKDNPVAGLRCAVHVLRWTLAHMAHPGLMPKSPPQQLLQHSAYNTRHRIALALASAAMPREAWLNVAPLLLRELRRLQRRRRSLPREERGNAWSSPSKSVNATMRAMLSAAAIALAPTDSAWVWQQLQPFLGLRSRTAARLSAEVIGALRGPLPPAAVAWVLDDLRRLAARGSQFQLSRYWHGRAVVRHVWDSAPEARADLVDAIRRFHDPYERQNVKMRRSYVRDGYPDSCRNLVGLPQYLLLSALPPEAMDDATRERLAQWDSKFCTSNRRLRRPRPSGWLLSRPDAWKSRKWAPIRSCGELVPSARLSKVPDRAWIEMASPGWAARIALRWKCGGRFRVDTPERACEATFRQAARTNPGRFVRLAFRLPLDAADFWFESVLEAAAATEPDKERAAVDWRAASAPEVERCLARLAERDGKYLAMALARLVQARPHEAWSESTVHRICSLATCHHDPKSSDDIIGDADGNVTGENVVQMSINCTRGVAVDAIKRLLWTRPENRERLVEAANEAVRDPHPAVRVAAVGLAGPLLGSDPEQALALMAEACGGQDVRVLHSFHLHHLLQYVWWRCDPRVEAIIERMATSGQKGTEDRGAFFATVIALRKGRMQSVFVRCVAGTILQRTGVALALAHLTDSTPEGRDAATRLAEFFNDPDTDVAGAAASVFRDQDILNSPVGPELAKKFALSDHFVRDPDDLVYPLAESTVDLVPYQTALASIVARATTDMLGMNGDIRRSTFGFSDRASECILRIYARAQGSEHASVRSWCLDQFDALLATGDQFGEQALARLDSDA